MIQVALDAAYAAGEILKEHFGKIPEEAIRKKSETDFLSFVDEQSEQKIISIISKAFPEHAFLAEEQGSSKQDHAYRWIIDPLDGTTNYIHSIPMFCVSIALQHQGELVLGVIYDPLRGELFRAEKGKGAYLNDTPIRVTENNRLSDCLLATGFPFKIKHILPRYLNMFSDIFEQCLGIRRMGSAAMDLAYLACGRMDGFWEIGLSPWDVAAGAVILREAGGRISDFWDEDRFMERRYLLASNGLIHKQLGTIIRRQYPEYKAI